jgi:hypothetical protein
MTGQKCLLTGHIFMPSNVIAEKQNKKQVSNSLLHCLYKRINDQSKTDFGRAKIKLTSHFDWRRRVVARKKRFVR